MARFQQRENGAWTASIRRVGWPDCSKTFKLKSDAQVWARATERAMDIGSFVPGELAEKTRFESIALRYVKEVLPKMRGKPQGEYLIRRLIEVFGKYKISSMTAAMLSTYRDERLAHVSAQTVVHELGMISRILKAAQLDWGIVIPGGHPVSQVRKPKVESARTRRLEPGEEPLLLRALDECSSKFIKPAFQLAIETAARQSEILSMSWEDVDLDRRVVRLRGAGGGVTKSGEAFRDVPLTLGAVQVLKGLEKPAGGRGRVLALTQSTLLQAWPRAVKRARRHYLLEKLESVLKDVHGLNDSDIQREIRRLVYKSGPTLPLTLKEWDRLEREDKKLDDLRFHDLRHEATSRLADKLEMHELMKVTGHKTSAMLSRYYHPRAEALALKLD